MKLLITGGFGNLGQMCLRQALAAGHQLRVTDVDSPNNRRLAKRCAPGVEVILGDIRDIALQQQCLQGVDGVIHNASLLPPLTETNPELAKQINVNACLSLIVQAEAQPKPPRFVFPSSVTVFGLADRQRPLRSASDPVVASDNYTKYKLAIEDALKHSRLPWVVLRVGVSVDSRTLKTDRATFRQLLGVHPDTPLEYVHPNDVALAMCRAVSVPEAVGKTLLIGGGNGCRISHGEFIACAFSALGLTLPVSALGTGNYYTHWMDTREAQHLLGFQLHRFADYQREVAGRLSMVRVLVRPVRPLLQWLLPSVLKCL